MAWIGNYQEWLSESDSLKNAQLVASHLIKQGWTKQSISALCGNMRVESSINPDMYEFGYDWSQDRGYGLVQWTPRSKYWDWAVSRGLNPRDGDSQLDRIDYEVDQNIQWISTPNYPETYVQFRNSTKSVTYLTAAFTWNYERPDQADGESSMAERVAFANRCLNELKFDGSAGGEPGDGSQLAVFPADYIQVTQGEFGSFSHYAGSSQELAIDFVFPTTRYPLKAPFDSEVIDVFPEYAQVNWRSTVSVTGADGSKHEAGQLVYIIVHDHDFDRWSVGDTIKKGEHVGNSGNAGNSTADHMHLQVLKGNNQPWPTPVSVQLHIYDIFAVNGVNIVDGGGYDWKESDFIDGDDGGSADPTTADGDIITLLMSGALNGW